VDVVGKAVRYTRDCPNIDRGSSIRGSIKSLDHAISSAELRGAGVVNLEDAAYGLKLGLRGRIRLRADLVGFDDSPAAFMKKNDEVVEDVLWYAARDVGADALAEAEDKIDMDDLASEMKRLMDAGDAEAIQDYPTIYALVRFMEEAKPWESPSLVSDLGDLIRESPAAVEPKVLREYRLSALELLANALLADKKLEAPVQVPGIFIPKRMG
jgi:hypothetical protein